jgi:glycosyltransferase involved in cell wall biosynthesis
MNILYISKYLVLPQYGPPTRQYYLSKYLSKIANNKVLLIGSRSSLCKIGAFKGLFINDKSQNLETVILNGPKIAAGFSLKRIWSWIIFEKNVFLFRKKIKTFRPDVIIVSSLSILTFLSGIFFKKWLGAPLVIEVRDLYPLTLEEVGKFSSLNPLVIFLKWIEKAGYRNADFIISTLPNAAEHIGNVIRKPFKFEWIPMGIDEEFFSETSEKRIDFSLSTSDKFIIGYAGTIGRANALDIIFESAKHLEVSYPNIQFIFIGDGPLKPFYIRKYGNLENVQFINAVPKKELQNFLKQMDLLVNSWLDKPIYRFGISPNKWMDYMYAAKPILVSYSGYKSILEEAKCGVFTPSQDVNSFTEALVELSKKPKEHLQEMGMNGRNYLLNHLSYRQLANQLNKILLLVVSTVHYSK